MYKKIDCFRDLGLVRRTPSVCDKYMKNETEKTTTPTKKLSKTIKLLVQNIYSCYTQENEEN